LEKRGRVLKIYMKRVCIFAGAKTGNEEIYVNTAKELGKLIASENLELIFGGGDGGLMGAVSNSALNSNAKVIGIVTDELFPFTNRVKRKPFDMIVVNTLSERKRKMIEISDSFIVLPGGIGTLDEFSELWTMFQLHLIDKPCVLLNVKGYFDNLIDFLKTAVNKGFLEKEYFDLLIIEEDPAKAIIKCRDFKHPKLPDIEG